MLPRAKSGDSTPRNPYPCSSAARWALSALVLLSAEFSYAQCSSMGTPVNERYQADTNGRFCLMRNEELGITGPAWNFTVDGRRILLADPTALVLGDYVYVTGTSTTPAANYIPLVGPTFNRANFPIYRSRDLIHWEFFGTAFPDGQRHGDTIQLNAGRRFCLLESPQLFAVGSTGDSIALTFSGVEDRQAGYCELAERHRLSTAFVTTISRQSFLQGGRFASPGDGREFEPRWYTYTPENTVTSLNFRYDGGYSVGRTIPVTGAPELEGSAHGHPYWSGYRMCHRLMGCNTWIALDTFTFYDPATQTSHLSYTWSDGDFANPDWRGNHIATAPLLSPSTPERLNRWGVVSPLAYMQHEQNQINGVNNGCYGPVGRVDQSQEPFPRCVAEGPAVFQRAGKYYLLFSRNYWDSPGYGVFYRMADSYAGLALPRWDDRSTPELPLLVAADRAFPYGTSFGHGEVFQFRGRTYLIVHKKDHGGSGLRSLYFKELSFQSDGSIEPLVDSNALGPRRNVRNYLVSRD